ncbi:MAG: MmcQ/YjbR family DNA-binding protein, partial [Candidatus Saccharimonadales bacterium]
MTQAELHDYLLSYPNTWVDTPFGDDALVYKIGHKDDATTASDGKFFAIIQNDSKPLKLSVKCDPQLAELLREKYETVL